MDDRLFEQTLSHTSRRGLSCCVSWLQPSAARFFPPPLGKPHRLSAAQPFHDWTEWSNTKVYYVARSCRPLFRWTNPPHTFKVANSTEGEEVREQENSGMGERECGRVKKVSLHHLGWYHLKAELYQSLWFRSLRFNKPGAEFSDTAQQSLQLWLSLLTFFFLGIQLSDFNLYSVNSLSKGVYPGGKGTCLSTNFSENVLCIFT